MTRYRLRKRGIPACIHLSVIDPLPNKPMFQLLLGNLLSKTFWKKKKENAGSSILLPLSHDCLLFNEPSPKRFR